MEELELLYKEQKDDIIQAIKDNRLYDHICCNYWRIEDNILLELLKECIATLETNQNDTLIENLKEFEEWE